MSAGELARGILHLEKEYKWRSLSLAMRKIEKIQTGLYIDDRGPDVSEL